MSKLSKFVNLFLRSNKVRCIISYVMTFLVLKLFRGKALIYKCGNSSIGDKTIESNLRIIDANSDLPDNPDAHFLFGIGTNQGGVKADMLIEPINAFLAARLRDRSQCDVLSIGPRSLGELLNLRSHGYSFEKIVGVDLFSLFKKIQVGDMHRLPFPESYFDVVLCGWVLAYSKNRELAAREIVRVLKPGGVFSIGVSYSKESNEDQYRRRGYLIGTEDRIVNCQQILGYFADSISETHFLVEPDQTMKHSHMLVMASVK